MNWKSEAEKLTDGVNVFKPTTGKYTLVFLTEPEDCEFVSEDGTKTAQIKMLIEVSTATSEKKEKFTWYVGKGSTTQSVFGQLAIVGESKGKLLGEVINLTVNHINGKNTYVIDEAIALRQSKESS